MLIGIPASIDSELEIHNDYTIDMNETHFGLEKEKLAAFIYIRNCGLKNKLDFSKCPYNDKEEYLIIFIQNPIEVQSKELIDTWVSILSDESRNNSILNQSELDEFKKRNENLIIMIKTFINSLMLYKAKNMEDEFFHTGIDQEFYHTEYDKISIINLFNIIKEYNQLFINILGEFQLVYFDKLFNEENEYYLMYLINEITLFNELFSMIFNSILDNKGAGIIR